MLADKFGIQSWESSEMANSDCSEEGGVEVSRNLDILIHNYSTNLVYIYRIL